MASAAAVLLVAFLIYNLGQKGDDITLPVAEETKHEVKMEISVPEEKIEIASDEVIEVEEDVVEEKLEEGNRKHQPKVKKEEKKKQKKEKVKTPVVEEEKEEILIAEHQPEKVHRLVVHNNPAEEVKKSNSKKDEGYASLGDFAGRQFKKRVLEDENPDHGKMDELAIMETISKGASLIVGDKAGFEEKEGKGEMKEYALNIGKFKLSRKVRKR